MIKSLVTGGAGFIGCHVVNHLIKMGHEVVVLDDLSGGSKNNINSQAIFINGSVEDEELVKDIFNTHKFTYVYHLAAYAAEGLSHYVRMHNYRSNLMGSASLINESINHDVKCFVFTSSIAVYGTNTLPMTESAVPQPGDPYGISKYAIELDLKAAYEMFGLNYVIFRPHNVYGEFQNIGDRYRNVIGIFMNQILNDRPLTIFGDGKQSRAFSYIDDVAPHIANAVNVPEAQNQIFNIGSDKVISINALAEIVIEVMGAESSIEYLEARNEVVHAYSDHTKLKHVFQIKDESEASLRKGLDRMAVWVKEQGAKETKIYTDLEISKKISSHWMRH
ncbi:NAD-dependent epimerase/dehydratase family protein [Fulvivirgaceae bacterium BMA10]|uniref:NAD-dependent epimerase/dehydratase family protein n=1 Tax=Splendidivirga corallicola TaxID=3051826 RepID=A0ABT8KHP1_9BACT|nr:NAD-dependent epimerase/dehydratase family protein [Fulvivirgaceae bacterium BMA10]